VLDDLQQRLSRTIWPDDIAVDTPADPASQAILPAGWHYGLPAGQLRPLVARWTNQYDWRAWETRLNGYPQFVTDIDGQQVHFLHVKSAEPDAVPLILTHGWPGSIIEYLNVIEPLTNPTAHGHPTAQAFDLVIPSLPGFGFSGPTRQPGWNRYRIARAWLQLMDRLGYPRFGAVGNDAGSMIAPEIGRLAPDRVIGVHVTQIFSFPTGDPAEMADLSPDDHAGLHRLQWFWQTIGSFNQVHSQQPQTLAYALADSPTGLLAWMCQLFGTEADPDFILTNVMTYWVTGTTGSAIRLYFEDAHATPPTEPTTTPLGLAMAGGDFISIRRFADRDHKNITSWHTYDKGSHWQAHLQPAQLVTDIRQFYEGLRKTP
jgi:pimeloyl-ACP methyl ester carboxylesterase